MRGRWRSENQPTHGGYGTRYTTRVTYDDNGYAVTHRHVIGWGYDDGQRSFHRSWHCDDWHKHRARGRCLSLVH
jgi:hypothetical protein